LIAVKQTIVNANRLFIQALNGKIGIILKTFLFK